MENLEGVTASEMVAYLVIGLLTIVFTAFKKIAPKFLEAIWRKIITSKSTPERLNWQERTILKKGIAAQMEEVRQRMSATRIILFQEKINGTNSLQKLIDTNDGKLLQAFDGVATQPFSSNFNDFRKNGYTHIANTATENTYRAFAQFLKHLGINSCDVYDIKNTNCAFLIIYENQSISYTELRHFAELQLSACKDAIIELYAK